ncbi:AraC family transcriptional regulator [Methylobacterium sp. J-026]|uniref:AraC family transcriptional regulator n=1 Tax=Methylobacterium sp. J-026 TaxID=2836624 RepID=UPI001FBA9BAA|nr:AraC family transcriptional regulator [Methylobacterium sp. J-026]MCJ2133272.1 AraC family transcriptional regulator [Methylobacterium sp. J-026]
MSDALETFRGLQRVYDFPARSGTVQTLVPRVKLFWSTEKTERTPTLPNQSIVIMISGRKTAHLDGARINYDQDNYLVVSMPVPFECASDATERDPLLGMSIDIDLPALNRFADIPGAVSPPATEEPTFLPPGLQPAPVDTALSDAVRRLVRMLRSPSDTLALGASTADEIVYHALKGTHGAALLALTRPASQHARIARAISRIHRGPARTLAVDELATVAGMSVRSFHRAFKAATRKTPLQYIKIVRLSMAMSLLQSETRDVSAVARQVGYESGSQFSREFKRHFHVTPTDVKARRQS